MSDYDSTAWVGGILITPQHFEKQEQSMKAEVRASISRLGSHMWGVDQCRLDEAMLPLGIIKIKQLAGRFEDGTEFYFGPQGHHSIELALPEIVANETIYLAIANNTLVSETASTAHRYTIDEIIALNTVDIDAPATPVLTRRLNLQLIREAGKKDGCFYFPLLKITKADPDNGIVLDHDYIPPSLNVIQDINLMGTLSRSVMLIERKQKQLAGLLGAPLQSRNISSLTDISLLQTLNKYQMTLQELADRTYLHPHRLYRAYQLLLAELGTYYQEKRMAIKLPLYDHLALQACFAAASTHFTELLQLKFEHQANQLVITKDEQHLYHVHLDKVQNLENADLILGLRVSDEQQRDQLTSLTKVAAEQEINDIINLQLSGLPYKQLDLVPPQLPYYDDMLYLRLEKTGKHWLTIAKEKQLALQLGGLHKGVQVMLWAIPGLNNRGVA
jgi:type VI secretion system protein ImpJ